MLSSATEIALLVRIFAKLSGLPQGRKSRSSPDPFAALSASRPAASGARLPLVATRAILGRFSRYALRDKVQVNPARSQKARLSGRLSRATSGPKAAPRCSLAESCVLVDWDRGPARRVLIALVASGLSLRVEYMDTLSR